MRIEEMNWPQVENYLQHDQRCVLPLGSTEQHANLSLSVDSILAEKVALDAAQPLGVPVFPRVNYGLAPYFMAYPGTITLRVETLLAVVRDVLDSMATHGFNKVLIVNGHGGNNPVLAMAQDWMRGRPEVRIKFHNWWMAPKTWAKVQAIDSIASHASWMENFPWTRLPNIAQPEGQKPPIDMDYLRQLDPSRARELLGDGNFAGEYQKPDEVMLALWDVAVSETRELLEGPWG